MCTKSALLYPTDRKGCLQKKQAALCVKEEGLVAMRPLLMSSEPGQQPVHFPGEAAQQGGSPGSTVVPIRGSQTVRSGPRPVSCLQLNL